MAENFDPYRDALVVETLTVWPDDLAGTPAEEHKSIEERLHADPQQAAKTNMSACTPDSAAGSP